MNTSPALLGHAPDANGWMPIETAPTDGAFVFLYWPTMSITAYPQVGFSHGDEYGWELAHDRDYGEVIPTHWRELFAPPPPKPPVSPSLPLVPLPAAEPSTACILPAVEGQSPAPQEAQP